jgi:hypothetical protein
MTSQKSKNGSRLGKRGNVDVGSIVTNVLVPKRFWSNETLGVIKIRLRIRSA